MTLEAVIAAAVREGLARLEAKVDAQTAEISALRATLPPALKRPAEVEELYGIPRSSQRRYIREGRLKKVTIGRTVLIDVSHLRPVGADEIATMAAEARR